MLAPEPGDAPMGGRTESPMDRAMSLLAVAAGIALLASVFVTSPDFIQSDSAAGVLLADRLLRSGGLVSPDWIYVSDSLALDGRVQAAMLGVAVWGATAAAYVSTVAIGALFFLASCCLLCRQLGAAPKVAFAVSAGMLLGPSYIHQDIVLGLAVSIQMGWALLLVLASLRFLARSNPALVLAFAIVALSSVSSPKKALAYQLLPLLGALAVNGFFARWAGSSARGDVPRRLVLGLALVAAWIAGDLVHAELLDGLMVNQGYARFAQTISLDRMLANAALVGELIGRFMGQGNSIGHVATVVLCCLAVVVLLALPVLTRDPRRFLGSSVGLAYLFAAVGIAVILAYLLTYDEVKRYYGVYYLLIPGSTIAAVAAWAASARSQMIDPRVATGVVMTLLVLGILNAASLLAGLPRDYRGIGRNQLTTNEQRLAVVRWLQDQGATHGFANFWDANAMTLLSEGKLQVGSILTPVTGGMQRHGWLVDVGRRDYKPADGDRWFIAIPTRRCGIKLPDECRAADADLRVGAYHVLMFSRAVPGCLPSY